MSSQNIPTNKERRLYGDRIPPLLPQYTRMKVFVKSCPVTVIAIRQLVEKRYPVVNQQVLLLGQSCLGFSSFSVFGICFVLVISCFVFLLLPSAAEAATQDYIGTITQIGATV